MNYLTNSTFDLIAFSYRLFAFIKNQIEGKILKRRNIMACWDRCLIDSLLIGGVVYFLAAIVVLAIVMFIPGVGEALFFIIVAFVAALALYALAAFIGCVIRCRGLR